MKKSYLLSVFLVCCIFPFTSKGQEIRSITSSTMLGIGASNILDTYLTPLDYKGVQVSFLNERLQVAAHGGGKRVNQQLFWVNYASTDNEAENGLVASGFIGYSWGTMWRKNVLPQLSLLVGPYIAGDAGFIYNLRNGNNPADGKFALKTGASAMAIYQLHHWKKFPITLRYEMQIPVMRIFFSPHYGQSYYEIFSLGNTHDIINFGSFHNSFDMNNLFTIDLPIRKMTLRLGYLNTIHNTKVNEIKTRVVNNSFLIGFSKEFLPFNRKKNRIDASNINKSLF